MNRIKLSPLAIEQPENLSADGCLAPKESRVSPARSTRGEFSIFSPIHYEKNYSYPLIIWLHGDDADCSQMPACMPQISVRNYVAIAPQSGFAASSPISWPNCDSSLDAAYEATLSAIDEAALRFNIDPSKIFLAGVGTGGTMAFHLAFERPEIFAGVISIGGLLDNHQVSLRDWERCRQIPVLISAFEDEENCPEQELCENLRLLFVAGFTTTVRQYPHSLQLSNKVLSDIDRWIIEQFESAIV